MFPLRDENPTEVTPYATMAIIAINIVVWVTVEGMGASQPFLHSIGASGAISGVMGAYLLLYPRVRGQTLFVLVIIVRVCRVPAWVMLGYWFLLQLASGTLGGGLQGVA